MKTRLPTSVGVPRPPKTCQNSLRCCFRRDEKGIKMLTLTHQDCGRRRRRTHLATAAQALASRVVVERGAKRRELGCAVDTARTARDHSQSSYFEMEFYRDIVRGGDEALTCKAQRSKPSCANTG